MCVGSTHKTLTQANPSLQLRLPSPGLVLYSVTLSQVEDEDEGKMKQPLVEPLCAFG